MYESYAEIPVSTGAGALRDFGCVLASLDKKMHGYYFKGDSWWAAGI